jgi:hypothetical protein
LPWFGSPATEGLADIPRTYEVWMTRRVTTRGKEMAPAKWRTLRLERILLDFGSFLRCLEADGKSPCSDDWNQELERQTKKRHALSDEDRARIEALARCGVSAGEISGTTFLKPCNSKRRCE